MTDETIEKLTQIFNERAPIARYFGMKLAFNEREQAMVRLPYNPGLDQAQGGVHGGVYATMLDSAGWFTAAVAYKRSSWLVTSELSIHFLEPVKEEELIAIGTMIKKGKRQAIVEMDLRTATGGLAAHAVGTFIPQLEIPFLE
jgi:uncharacterized protein (TIGR00369 family)